MNKLSTFLYCHDPLDESSGEFLLHLANPAALVKIISLDEQNVVEGDEFISKTFTYEFEDNDTEEYQFVFMNFTGTPTNAEDANRVLDAAWEFWLEVLDTDDEDY